MIFNHAELKEFIKESGIKQKSIAAKSGIEEWKLCLILSGSRKCEVGEYASICDVLGVNLERFIQRETKNC